MDSPSIAQRVRYLELEALVEQERPGLVQALKSGSRLVFVKQEMIAPDLSDHELSLIGAIVKVCGWHNCTLVVGDQSGVVVLRPEDVASSS